MEQHELVKLMKIFLLSVCIVFCAAEVAVGANVATEKNKPASLAQKPIRFSELAEDEPLHFDSGMQRTISAYARG